MRGACPIVYVCVNRRAPDTCRRADLRGRHEHADTSLSRTFYFPPRLLDPIFCVIEFHLAPSRASRPIGERSERGRGRRSRFASKYFHAHRLANCFPSSPDFSMPLFSPRYHSRVASSLLPRKEIKIEEKRGYFVSYNLKGNRFSPLLFLFLFLTQFCR